MASDAFAKRLRAYRKLKQYTQRDLAGALGVSVAIVGGFERGTRVPNHVEVERITTLLKVTREELGFEYEELGLEYIERSGKW